MITLAEQAANSDSCKRLSQRPRLSRPRRERGKAPPARHHRIEQKRWAWHEVSPRPRLTPETPCGGGSRNDASTRQRRRWRKENSQPWVSEQYICFSAHVLQRQPGALRNNHGTTAHPQVTQQDDAIGSRLSRIEARLARIEELLLKQELAKVRTHQQRRNVLRGMDPLSEQHP